MTEVKITKDKYGRIGEETREHESFGMISLSRVSVGGDDQRMFFGSDVSHDAAIMLTIHSAHEVVNDSGFTRYHPARQIVELYLTPSQFSTLLTSLNYGSGVPCTLRTRPADGAEFVSCQFPTSVTKSQRIRDAVKKRAGDLISQVRNLTAITKELVDGKVNKTILKEFEKKIVHIQTDIEHNLPWYAEVIQDHLDKAVVDAKADVDEFVTQTIVKTGIETIKNNNIKLLEDSSDKL